MTRILSLISIAAAVAAAAGCTHKAPSPVKPRTVIIDVRTQDEQQETGYIMGAMLIEHTAIHTEIKNSVPDNVEKKSTGMTELFFTACFLQMS